MGTYGLIFMPSFVKIDQIIQKLNETHTSSTMITYS